MTTRKLKWESVDLTLASLVKDKREECATALKTVFLEGIELGLEPREAFYRAETVHVFADHTDLVQRMEEVTEVGDENVPTNDEEIHAFIESLLEEALASPTKETGDVLKNDQDETRKYADLFKHWYDLHRSWGASIKAAYTFGVRNIQELYVEARDVDLDEARDEIAGLPDHLRDGSQKVFEAEIEAGETVVTALEAAQDYIRNAAFVDMMVDSVFKRAGGFVN